MRRMWFYGVAVALVAMVIMAIAADERKAEHGDAPSVSERRQTDNRGSPTGRVTVVIHELKSRLNSGEACPVLVQFVNTMTKGEPVCVQSFPRPDLRGTEQLSFVVTDETGHEVERGPIPEGSIPSWLYWMDDDAGKKVQVLPVWVLEPNGGVVRYVEDALKYHHEHLTNGIYTLSLRMKDIRAIDPKAVLVRHDLGSPPMLAVANVGPYVGMPVVQPNGVKIEIVGKGHSASPDSTNRPPMAAPFVDRTKQ